MYRSKRYAVLLALGGIASASAQNPSITEYPIPSNNSDPTSITAGPDGNIWFTEQQVGSIAKITPAGVITEFPISAVVNVVPSPQSITTGADGNLWFTEVDYADSPDPVGSSGKIGKITPSGEITEFSISTAYSYPSGIASGPDGNLWFTEAIGNKIGRITTAGAITEFPIPTSDSNPAGITLGPDGNLWFVEGIGAIGRITPAGVISEFPFANSINDPSLGGASQIASGPDGNLWFTNYAVVCSPCSIVGSIIGRITPSGTTSVFSLPSGSSAPQGIVSAPNGNLWFTESNGNNIGTITSAGVITEYAIHTAGSGPAGIAADRNGNLWFTESQANNIGKADVGSATAITAGFTGNWYDTSESGHGFSIEVLPNNQMLAEWFVFAPYGGQSWIVATGPITGNTAVLQGFQPVGSGGRFPPNFNGSQLQNQPWGTITFKFTDCNDGTVSWQPTAAGYTSGSIPISRLTMPVGLSCP